LELGCGYGRALQWLAPKARKTVGIDTSLSSLALADENSKKTKSFSLIAMDVVRMGFQDEVFDCVVCIQNGISAFHVDPKELIRESLRITKKGGKVLFSTYSPRFWDHRLEWFRKQSEEGLLGEIDREKTRNGNIVCKDGFKATAIKPDDFINLTWEQNVDVYLEEVNGSSLFCELRKK
jgi:2-polyprenyl-6-hydroxyphenyl methylase/3-demethylubiquinone-9 3-methyltransferase